MAKNYSCEFGRGQKGPQEAIGRALRANSLAFEAITIGWSSKMLVEGLVDFTAKGVKFQSICRPLYYANAERCKEGKTSICRVLKQKHIRTR